jgi:hypothetical protein
LKNVLEPPSAIVESGSAPSQIRTIARLGSLYPFKGSFKGYQLFAHVIEPIENIVNAVFVLAHGDHATQTAAVQSAR